ncbi:MAG: choice-of-anchor D domain-containing protein [Terracidiphilus sp.]
MASKTSGGPSSKAFCQNRFLDARARAAVLAAAGALLVACVGAPAQSANNYVAGAGSGARNGGGIIGPANPHLGMHPGEPIPPRVAQAETFLARRGLKPGQRLAPGQRFTQRDNRQRPQPARQSSLDPYLAADSSSSSTGAWQPLGPTAVLTSNFGLVTGRISSIALDPNDATGNHVYVGTTGGGIWETSNAAASNVSLISFTPLTDSVSALEYADDASISIGAVAVAPGGTGVILAGTGDPNDVLDSYYGAGILRSTDGGTTWTLIQQTQDREDNLSLQDYKFVGEGFAGFAWSTTNTQLVVAAVSQAYEGTLVNADQASESYEGLYYSQDAGATWHLATITDGSGEDVQGPLDAFASPDGNAATAVVWNPVRKLFIAAVRYHGFYQSADGVAWNRLANQPSTGIKTLFCPVNVGQEGSVDCPIYRAALAVNPVSGDTFAWSVDRNNQDQGLWQDQCQISGTSCGNPNLTFTKQWNTTQLETGNSEGAATILNGNYDLTLAAVPSKQDTLVLAGANDLWKCSLAMGCQWRNTTNSTSCMSAQVAEFQHALAWSETNPDEILVGNDSGLWRSVDAIGESGAACNTTDASHFQNLNGSLGSLAEVESMSAIGSSPYTMMAGLGVNGTAGVKSGSATTDWPQILSGYGGPVAIDATNFNDWYVNASSGVDIYLCSQSAPCTPGDFGTNPVVSDGDVSQDGEGMGSPAPFLVDPVDASQLLVSTCRLWRGPASGAGWSTSNAVTPILDSGSEAFPCAGDALIRSMAAMALAGGGEVVYLGMYGSANGGANLPGHVLKVQINPSSSTPAVVTDLTTNPVVNDINTLNYFGYDISSLFIDPHDTTGDTVYVTVAAFESTGQYVQTVYRSTDGGNHWSDLTSNLPDVPVNGVVVDPNGANTVYLATDQGVFFTAAVPGCALPASVCWSPFGSGLPAAPVVSLSAAPLSSATPLLAAATYGRGIFTTALWSSNTGITTVNVAPASLTFGSLPVGTASTAETVTIKNTGNLALLPSSITLSGDFTETDGCVNQSIAPGSSCAIQVEFIPSAIGARSGVLTFFSNLYGGQLQLSLSGTGTASGVVTLSPNPLSFGKFEVGSSTQLPVTAANSSNTSISITSLTISGPFAIATNACGTTALAASADCQIQVDFNPTATGAATGTLTLVDGAGTQSIQLTGTGLGAATDALTPTSLSFVDTQVGQASSQQTVTLTNSGGVPLTSISVSVSNGFEVSNGCTTELAANSSCSLQVEFAPTAAGSLSGTLTVSDILRTQTVALSGIGLAPGVIAVSPTSLTFTNQQPGVASAPQTLRVTNTGGASIANIDLAFTGAAASSYSLGANTCGALLAAGASCAAQVIFTPSGVGSVTAVLNISSSTLGVQAVPVALNGSPALSGGLTVSPSIVTFGVDGMSQTSSAQTVTLTNSASSTISSISLAVAGPFSLVTNTCTGSLAPGAGCAAAVVFSPTVAGPVSGTLTVNSPSLASPIAVALIGTGFNFTVSAVATSSQTVAAGQTASYTLAINPSGAQATFSFACGTLPQYASCSFSPATETLNSGVEGNVTVNISTGEVSSSKVEPAAGWQAAPLLCGLLLLPFALARKRKALLLAVLACVLAAGVTACTSSSLGSGGSGTKQTSTTPPGTYTIPVTTLANGMSQPVTLTLTVD